MGYHIRKTIMPDNIVDLDNTDTTDRGLLTRSEALRLIVLIITSWLVILIPIYMFFRYLVLL